MMSLYDENSTSDKVNNLLMSKTEKRYYNLTVFCDGTCPGFIVDEDTIASFKKSFDNGEEMISFTNKDNNSDVVLRNRKLVGYQKAVLDERNSQILEENE